ncbi:MAG: Phospho-N-acetylmuramoyl-pentapeptide-transferase [candidate division TM6 bacterium GW2011_GWF2_38_10]|nr:MAG: Phospho-N-acetylmuramoyl-pentapeptide-transferase [candidate division TM6 bacterium GW2011_GWF2_38_10]
MIYHLSQNLQNHASFFNVFHYVSVRVIGALLTALFFSFLFGSWFIRFCQRYFQSNVREYTPQTHVMKNNTPTMGGLFMIGIFLVNSFLWNDLSKPIVWIFLLCIVSFGLIGFLDDWYKIFYKKGINASLKFKLQIASAAIVALSWFFILAPDTRLCMPFFKFFNPDLGYFIIPWAMFIMVATSNAVNLTDGLDGLATGPLIFNFSTFALISYLAGHKLFAHYLYIPFVPGATELTIFAATLIGALVGFLWYNTYPAQIFMGDVGALSFGAGLAFSALIVRQELLLLMCGGVFVLETMSVILQVASFKLYGKRLFKMAPIHHHFELIGWKETKITVRFWIVSFILALLTLLTLKIR